MDLYCPTCGEPWENDTLHDVAEETGQTYSQVLADFRKRGCKALAAGGYSIVASECVPKDNMRAHASAALMDIMPDDPDGVMSMMDDLDFMGMLD